MRQDAKHFIELLKVVNTKLRETKKVTTSYTV